MGTELYDYVRRPDACFHWTRGKPEYRDRVTIYNLWLTSQTWRGIDWEHRLLIFVPDALAQERVAYLYATGYDATPWETALGIRLANATGMPCAFLYHLPNQPLFSEELIEDALIAYTFQQYLETEEPDLPLLFPMVKSVTRAMDAIQTALQETLDIRSFVVSGMSKRGWTTWLTAAADSRVAGIIPMVFDNLNFPAQMAHQMEALGGFSASISDYTELDLPAKLMTPAGRTLTQLVDPYFYQERFTMPKLLIHGTNDPYWATDALNLYWSDLPAPKSVLYAPNSGHGLNDATRVWNAEVAFLRAVSQQKTLPALTSERDADTMEIVASHPARAGRVWIADSPTRDFRGSGWEPTPLEARTETQFAMRLPLPSAGYRAFIGELEFAEEDLGAYTLSTTPVILSADDS